ncbi:V-type ATP synthase subunit F [[Eubacterium] cellulosolvens]
MPAENSAELAEDKPTSASKSSTSKGQQREKQIAVIGDEDTVIGFGLTGIKYLTTINGDTEDKDILNSISEYLTTPGIGFIIITQSVAERIRAKFELLKHEKPLYPIFIELPDKHGELPDRIDPIKTLIRRAIGMEIVKDNQ